jgi:hypothetical protein
LFASRFLWKCLTSLTVSRFQPPPHRTGQADFPHPALLPASRQTLWDFANGKCFRSWPSATKLLHTHSNRVRLPLAAYPVASGLADYRAFLSCAPASLNRPRHCVAAGPLGSPDVTPVLSYSEPIRHPLAVHRFPGVSGYTASLLRRFLDGTRRVSPVA